MKIDLKNPFLEGINNLNNWRNRYSKFDYPFKIVQNIFYRQYTMNSIWESELYNSFTGFKNSEKNIFDAYEKIEIEYSNAAKAYALGNTLLDLMKQQVDIGGINYANSIALIDKSRGGDNDSTEELEFRYIYRLLSNKSVIMWAAFGRIGLTQSEAVNQILDTHINFSQSFQYAEILDLLGQSGVSQIMNTIYSPLPNIHPMNPTDAQIQQEINEIDRYYQLAMSSFHQKRYDDAIELFTKSIGAVRYVVALDSYMGRALCFMIVAKYQDAINDYMYHSFPPFEKESKNPARDINRFTNLGYACYKLGRYAEAIDFYKKVLLLDPFDQDAKIMLNKP